MKAIKIDWLMEFFLGFAKLRNALNFKSNQGNFDELTLFTGKVSSYPSLLLNPLLYLTECIVVGLPKNCIFLLEY